ncbi:MAG: 3-deoxy-manno-octulosonate cytidylyltransferase [Acidobacteria bacterium RIFCSPLOWO2_02_FULL_67_21]|nr:MAG: 3-deoxy-manno-octulosonate cytidylyltransferase [Acidobacteria bacterium RIFCSPLOWO2_02_FULL_67_21]
MHDVSRNASPAFLVVAVIPARYHSTRFPGKALADIAGRPMVEHVYRRAAAARGVDAVVVATDDPRIAAAVERFGGIARMTRASHRSGLDRVAEVAADLDCPLVVNVQGDEPLVEPDMIAEVVAALAGDPAVEMSTVCRRIAEPSEYTDPNVVKVVADRDGNALYFSRAPIPFERGGAAAPAYKHIGLYAYRRPFLLRLAALPQSPLEQAEALEQLRVLEHGFRIRTVVTQHDSIGVDTPQDLERVRRHLEAGVGLPST